MNNSLITYFKDRADAGKKLAHLLKNYKGQNAVVYALPRGGVIIGAAIAKALHLPLDLIIARKIGHPYQSEYAIGAVAENGHSVFTKEITDNNRTYIANESAKQQEEAKRRREVYLAGRKPIPCEGKIAILVDDGIATGLTIRVGIMELKHRHPKKIVVAVPVVPKTTADLLKKEVNELVALNIPSDDAFLEAVGAYYKDFPPVEDEDVIKIMKRYK